MVSHNSGVLSLYQNSSAAEEESNWQIVPMELRLTTTSLYAQFYFSVT